MQGLIMPQGHFNSRAQVGPGPPVQGPVSAFIPSKNITFNLKSIFPRQKNVLQKQNTKKQTKLKTKEKTFSTNTILMLFRRIQLHASWKPPAQNIFGSKFALRREIFLLKYSDWDPGGVFMSITFYNLFSQNFFFTFLLAGFWVPRKIWEAGSTVWFYFSNPQWTLFVTSPSNRPKWHSSMTNDTKRFLYFLNFKGWIFIFEGWRRFAKKKNDIL